MGLEPPKYLVIQQKILYEILFTLYNRVPQENKGASQKNQNKNFVKKSITKYFGGSDPMNELQEIQFAKSFRKPIPQCELR